MAMAALTIPVATVTVAFSSPAWAKAEKSITCKTISGNITGTITLSKCKGNTGGSSQPLTATALATGGKLVWSNSQSTTIGSPTLGTVTSPKCSGTADTVSAAITADTTGLTSLGTLTTEVCISGSTITGLKPVKIT